MAQLGTMVIVAIFLFFNASSGLTITAIFAMVLLIAVSNSFDQPARSALLPSLVEPQEFQAAITFAGSVRQIGFVTGPVAAGFLVGVKQDDWGYATIGYGIEVIMIGISVVTMAFLRPRLVDAPKKAVSLESIKEGLSYVRRQHIILGCMTLDMFAVIFGGATALLPIYAKEILDVGDWGYGILAASLDLGALTMAVVLVAIPPAKRPGIVLMWAVLAFGILTICFGLSRWFPASIAFYAMIGMADQVSVVMRNTTIQLNTPDALRGRVSSVNMLFIGASNQLGQAESGLVAAATSATFAVVSGGIGCLAVLGAVFAGIPEMRRYRVKPVVQDSTEGAPSPAGSG